MSRESIEASEAALKQLLERRFDDVELLILSCSRGQDRGTVSFLRDGLGGPQGAWNLLDYHRRLGSVGIDSERLSDFCGAPFLIQGGVFQEQKDSLRKNLKEHFRSDDVEEQETSSGRRAV